MSSLPLNQDWGLGGRKKIPFLVGVANYVSYDGCCSVGDDDDDGCCSDEAHCLLEE